MNRSAKVEIDGAVYTLPIIEDTEREPAIDISTLRSTTGHITLDDGSGFIAAAKDKASGKRLMGFGHRVYKNYDPRARLIKNACDNLLEALHTSDPLLDIAKRLEAAALEDTYFVEHKLYPNVDFYSGIIMRALGIPVEMFPVIFAIGRTPGWIANVKEIIDDPKARIYRPRQLYMGPAQNHYVPIEEREKKPVAEMTCA